MLDHNQFKFAYGFGTGVVLPVLHRVIRPNLKPNPFAAFAGISLGAVIGDDSIIDPKFFGGANFSDDGYVAAGALAGAAAMAGLGQLGNRLVHSFPGPFYVLGLTSMEQLVTDARRNNPALDKQYRLEKELTNQGILFEPPGLSESKELLR